MEDSVIIELFFQRSENAIHELANKYEKLCYNTAFNIVGNREDAVECINDSYLGVWNSIPPNSPDSLQAYLLRIVRNISINKLSFNSRAKRNSQYDACLDELAYCIPSSESVENEIELQEIIETIEEYLTTLNKTNRFLFIRRYWFLDSYAALSSASGLSEQAIRTRLSRIRKGLTEYLKSKGLIYGQ